ncbi:MAG: CBS domain-containing protein [Methanobrevibacter sp.]|uniref:CBS domain-containing protein n=1 Tax=Methanobrevibacter sp. TaxID=66852 RepID=UPI0025DE8996|nr:CBS domain-containing protein [Methanobrevibacter sp.]MBR3112485.1 CBS domain-containing protein [Methanobrevibacter sp.]MBR6992897.1 CBS domain-containing protein [Methanobrevibacter sp.]
MLTSVQKEILQTLINLYQSSDGKSIKGEDIAEVMGRNPGTIRNQMQSLRSLGLVKGVPGPRGGYKPTIEAYHSLNISVSDDDSKVPIYKNGKRIEDISVARIEFTSVPQPGECEAAIKVLGSIKDLNLGDTVSIGPTPVNNLGILGTIVGRDDMDNILLVDTKTIRSIPKQSVGDIASRDVISFSMDCSVKDASKKLAENDIDGAPVIKDGKVVGVFTLTDLVRAIAEDKENLTVGELMSTNVVIVNEDLKIANAIEVMLKKSISRLIVADNNQTLLGIVTRTDLINTITNLDQFPIITN